MVQPQKLFFNFTDFITIILDNQHINYNFLKKLTHKMNNINCHNNYYHGIINKTYTKMRNRT